MNRTVDAGDGAVGRFDRAFGRLECAVEPTERTVDSIYHAVG